MHAFTLTFLFAAGSVFTKVQAAPFVSPRQGITAISAAQISSFAPYTHFASAAYCTPAQTLAWNCGTNCDANAGFIPTASGGDGAATQFWFVGFDPTLNEVIVSHQGTNPQQIMADLTDADFFQEALNSTLFPGIASSIEAHSGFANEQAKTAADVLSAVNQAISQHGTTQVTMVGHSLGAAISLLDSVFLPLNLPSGTTFKTVTYGLPRVGNQDFANYIDTNAHLTHINNMEDPVPTLPGKFLGFHHPAGEIHITDTAQWDSCPGQDNPSTSCVVGDVPTVFDGNVNNHDGPYDGITMGC